MNIDSIDSTTYMPHLQAGEGSAEVKLARTEPPAEKRETPDETASGEKIKDLEDITERLNERLSSKNVSMRFYIHEATDEVVVKIIDNDSHEVVKEIPPSEMLDLKGRIDEMVGILLDRKI